MDERTVSDGGPEVAAGRAPHLRIRRPGRPRDGDGSSRPPAGHGLVTDEPAGSGRTARTSVGWADDRPRAVPWRYLPRRVRAATGRGALAPDGDARLVVGLTATEGLSVDDPTGGPPPPSPADAEGRATGRDRSQSGARRRSHHAPACDALGRRPSTRSVRPRGPAAPSRASRTTFPRERRSGHPSSRVRTIAAPRRLGGRERRNRP